jgi:hypothetical protein
MLMLMLKCSGYWHWQSPNAIAAHHRSLKHAAVAVAVTYCLLQLCAHADDADAEVLWLLAT